jgi:hypothetical protein
LSGVVEDERARCDREMRVCESHAPATEMWRQAPPHLANEIMKTSHG